MTSKPDVGIWIGIVSGVAVIGAIIAGVASVGGPSDARAYRLDEARLRAMQDIVVAAQCAYAFTGRVPATFEEIGAEIRDHRKPLAACNRVKAPEPDEAISYARETGDHIALCADFLRPSPPEGQPSNYFDPRPRPPELEAQRATAGRHCFSVRITGDFGDGESMGP
ncbi:MAG TPA: hypothetical protein VG841_00635 [Caulobacterales bacterium]|nr:hypothetical protein [Caulobacterales bacterium]